MRTPRWTFPGKKPGVWPCSRGLKGPLSAVWDSNLRSWCLKTIRQRPPSLPRPGPPHPGPRWAAVSKASAKTVGSLGRGLCGVGLCRGGPGVRHAEWKAGTSQATLLPRAVQWRQAWGTEHLWRGQWGCLRVPGSRGQNGRQLQASGPMNVSTGGAVRIPLPSPNLCVRTLKTPEAKLP